MGLKINSKANLKKKKPNLFTISQKIFNSKLISFNYE